MKKYCISFVSCVIFFLLVSFGMKEDFLALLQEKLNNYYSTHIPVKVHLFLNQPSYVSGDTLYYKITFVHLQGNRLVEGRQVVHLQLVDQSNKVAYRATVPVSDGLGSGQLHLPPTLPSGGYSVIVYHNVMRNTKPVGVFQQPLLIQGKTQYVLNKSSKPEFFVESGKLVVGVSNRMVIHASPLNMVTISDETATTVATAICDSSGWANVYFKPQGEIKYFYSIDQGKRFDLPIQPVTGVSMLVSGVDSGDNIRVAVQSSAEAKHDRHYILVLSMLDQVVLGASIDLRIKKSQVVNFTKEGLVRGSYAITLFDETGKVVSERLIFIDKESPKLLVKCDKSGYNVREKVTVKFTLPQASDSRVAVTVYQQDLFHSLQNYPVELPAYLERPTAGAEWLRQDFDTDMFMITQGQLGFWEDVWSGNTKPQFGLESFLRLTGKATFRSTGKPVPDSTNIEFFLQKDAAGYEFYTDDDGNFSFPLLFDFYGEEQIHYLARSNGVLVKDVHIQPEEVKFEKDTLQFATTNLTDRYYEFSKQRQSILLAYYRTRPVVSEQPAWLNKRIEDAMRDADIVIKLSDYILFPTMHETLLEIIPSVRSRLNKNTVRVALPDEHRDATEDPLYIIDGVITDNTAYFLSLNPKDVVMIKVINTKQKLAIIGGIAQNGIVMVDTRIPKHESQIPPLQNVFQASGFTPWRKTKSLMDRVVPDREPDLRSTLYWNPDVKITNGEATVTFFTANNTGTFQLVAEGITTTGTPLHTECLFNVTFGNP